MIHKTRVFCHEVNPEKLEMLGIEEKAIGTWLPFTFRMDTINAYKLTSSDIDEGQLTIGCTTVFTDNGDTFIIETPYQVFDDLYIRYIGEDASVYIYDKNHVPPPSTNSEDIL